MSGTRYVKGNIEGGFGVLPARWPGAGGGLQFRAQIHRSPDGHMPPAYKETNGWKTAEPADAVHQGQMVGNVQRSPAQRPGRPGHRLQPDPCRRLGKFPGRARGGQTGPLAIVSDGHREPSCVQDQAFRQRRHSTVGRLPASGGGSKNSVYSLLFCRLDASWEPDLWGSIRNTVAASTYAAQASAAQLENMRLTIQAELAVDFYELRAQDELIDLYSNTIVQLQRFARLDQNAL
jgi:hypothetical protein